MFVLPMHQPGVTVRPLVQMTGVAEFNEVFLDEARVPADWVVGDVNGGWGLAVALLGARADLARPRQPDRRRLEVEGRSLAAAIQRARCTRPANTTGSTIRSCARSWQRSTPASVWCHGEPRGACTRRSASSGARSRDSVQRSSPTSSAGRPRGVGARRRRRRLLRVPRPQLPGDVARRRDRRDPEEHARRARPGPAARAWARPQHTLLRPPEELRTNDERAAGSTHRSERRGHHRAPPPSPEERDHRPDARRAGRPRRVGKCIRLGRSRVAVRRRWCVLLRARPHRVQRRPTTRLVADCVDVGEDGPRRAGRRARIPWWSPSSGTRSTAAPRSHLPET